MKFGLSFLPDASESSKPSIQYFKDALALCKIADSACLHSVKMTEHYLHPYGGYCPSPLMFLSAVAAQTQHIRLMTGCILPAFHHPLQIAAKTVMLDVMSQGRLDVGFARAYLPYEFDAFGINLDESRLRYTSTIDAVVKLWTQKNVTLSTPFFKYSNASNMPDCVQTPHPPVWGAAVNARQSFAWLGEQGYGLLLSPPLAPIEQIIDNLHLYIESFYSVASRQHKKPSIAISLPLIMDEVEEKAIAKSDIYLNNYLNTWANACDAWSHRTSGDYPKYTGLSKILRSVTPQQMRIQRQALVGTPEKILDDIYFIHETLGISYFLWQIDTGSQPFDVSKKTLDLLSEKIIPPIKENHHETIGL